MSKPQPHPKWPCGCVVRNERGEIVRVKLNEDKESRCNRCGVVREGVVTFMEWRR